MTKDILHLARSVKPIRVGLSDGGELKDPTKRAAFMNLFNPKPANLPATVAAPAPAPSTPEENKALAVPSSGPASAENPDLIAKATKALMEAPVSRRKFLETSRNAVAAVNQTGNINKLLKPKKVAKSQLSDEAKKFIARALLTEHINLEHPVVKGLLNYEEELYPELDEFIDERPDDQMDQFDLHSHLMEENPRRMIDLIHGGGDHVSYMQPNLEDEIYNRARQHFKSEFEKISGEKISGEELKKLISDAEKNYSGKGIFHDESPQHESAGGEVEKTGNDKKLSPSEWIKHLAKKSDGGEADAPGMGHNNPPMDDHPEHFRELNKLGLYSKAAEVAQDATGQNEIKTPAEWHKYLLNRDVKPDELKWSHFENAFDPEEKVHKDDVAAHFNHQNQEPYTEQVYRDEGHDYENNENGIGQLALDMAQDPELLKKVMPQKHLQEHARRLAREDEDIADWLTSEWSHTLERYIKKQKNSEGEYPTLHSKYQMEGPSENYRELVLQHNPENEKFREAGHFPDAANPLVHLRMSDRKGLNGEKLLHIEELQSDWGQQGADAGFNEKQKEAKHKKWRDLDRQLSEFDFVTRNKIEKAIRFRNKNLSDNSIYQLVHGISLGELLSHEGEHDDIVNYNNLIGRHNKALNDYKAPMIEEGPHVGDTNKWTDLGLKRILKEAADGGYHGITFAPGIVQASRWGNTQGLIDPYDKTIPSRMQKLINNHDPSLKFETYSHDLPIFHDPEYNTTSTTKVHYLPMSEKAAASIKKGQERFRRGGDVKAPVAKSKNKLHTPAIIGQALNKIHSLPRDMDSTLSGQQGRLF